MAATVSVIKHDKTYAGFLTIADITFDTSYPTGGEAITANQLKFDNTIHFVLPSPASGYVFEFDHANKKLKAYQTDYDLTANGALVEVTAETNLSAVTVRVVAFGI
jgi:hypothetical protein